jgi:Vitamin K epoxide reductase family
MSAAAPPGWDENPTAWPKRRRIAALALVGLCVSTYLTLYQLSVISRVWDPFFAHGSPAVLGWTHPFPDAGLGVLAYAGELVLSFIGGPDRWRTLPWTVIAFGVVILTGAATSVALMIIQPVAVGDWCTLCLSSAALSLLILPLGVDEPLAGLQHLARVRSTGGSVWEALWGRTDRPRGIRTLEASR